MVNLGTLRHHDPACVMGTRMWTTVSSLPRIAPFSAMVALGYRPRPTRASLKVPQVLSHEMCYVHQARGKRASCAHVSQCQPPLPPISRRTHMSPGSRSRKTLVSLGSPGDKRTRPALDSLQATVSVLLARILHWLILLLTRMRIQHRRSRWMSLLRVLAAVQLWRWRWQLIGNLFLHAQSALCPTSGTSCP